MSKVLCIATSLWLFLFWLVVQVLASDEIIIRALYPNPPGSDEAEWILLENTTDQTLPGNYILRDGAGKVVEYQHNDQLQPGYLEIPRSLSKITLNNDSDWVELWQNDELVDISDTYKNLTEGKVFVKLDDAWSVIDLEDFQTRLENNDWLVVPAEKEDEEADNQDQNNNTQSQGTPKPVSITAPSATPKHYPSNTGADISKPGIDNTITKNGDDNLSTPDSGLEQNEVDRQLSTDFSYQQSLILPILKPRLDVLEVNQDSNDTNEAPAASPPVYPIPDVAAEQAVFLNWQRRALFGSLSLIFSGLCWELISVPRLWHWYNDRQCRW